MRIDSSGNLLVGKTDLTGNVAGISLRSTGLIVGTVASGTVGYFNRTTSDGTILDFRKDNVQVGSIGSGAGLYVSGANGGFRIHSGGTKIFPCTTGNAANDAVTDLGASDARWKDLYLSGVINAGPGTHTIGDGTGTPQLVLLAGTTAYSTLDFGDSDDGNIGRIEYIHSSDAMTFRTNNQERMRIDSSGNVLVGKTSASIATAGAELRPNGQVFATQSGNYPLLLNRTTSDGDIIQLRKDNTTVGSIQSRAGLVSTIV